MADVFQKTISINYQSGVRAQPWARLAEITQATPNSVAMQQTIGTTEELLTVGDVATLGECVFQNTDDTHYVEVGKIVTGVFTAFAKIPPLMTANFIPSCTPAQLAAKSNTAATKLDYVIYEA